MHNFSKYLTNLSCIAFYLYKALSTMPRRANGDFITLSL